MQRLEVYFYTAIAYNIREMENNAVEEKTEPTRFQIILGEGIEGALQRYINDKYGEGTRVYTAIIKRAVAEFLKKEGYEV